MTAPRGPSSGQGSYTTNHHLHDPDHADFGHVHDADLMTDDIGPEHINEDSASLSERWDRDEQHHIGKVINSF
jgi:hypothetical protein